MAPLHPFSTLPTSADGNVKAPYPRPAHDLCLILRLDPLQRQGAGARRTLRRNRYWNLLIHTLWHRQNGDAFPTGRPRSTTSSSTSRYESEYRKYQRTAQRMIDGSKCRDLKGAGRGLRTVTSLSRAWPTPAASSG
jgi:hypothetical protein